VIELVCGTLFLAASIALMPDDPARMALVWLMAIFLLALSVINLEHNRLPNGLLASVALLSVIVVIDDGRSLPEAIIGAALALICGLFFLQISRFFAGTKLLGWGDIKLLGAIGLAVSPEKALVFLGVCGALVVALAVELSWCRRKKTYPFGTAICAGAFAALF